MEALNTCVVKAAESSSWSVAALARMARERHNHAFEKLFYGGPPRIAW